MKTKITKARYQRNWCRQRRKFMIKMLGGKCIKCGITRQLEIDHINPSTKLYALGKAGSLAWEKIQEELKKCQLLCKAHHIEKHEASHGTVRRFRKPCRCDLCVMAHRQYWKDYRIKYGRKS